MLRNQCMILVIIIIYVIMMIQLLTALIFLAIVWFFIKFAIVPIRLKKHYVTTFRKLGYKVFERDFSFMGSPRLQIAQKHQREMGDCDYTYKHQLVGYDILVGNTINKIIVHFFAPHLVQNMLATDQLHTLHRYNPLQLIKSLAEKGLIFVDGQEWRESKKVLSKIFNFDFIASQVPSVVAKCDSVFHQFEGRAMAKGQNSMKIKLLDMTVEIISSVLLSSFMGMEATNELIKGKPIAKLVLQTGDEAADLTLKDPLVLFLGPKIVKTRIRQKYRQFLANKELMLAVFRHNIDRIENQWVHERLRRKPETILEAILEESIKEDSSVYSKKKILDQIFVVMFAGTDTTSNFVLYALLFIYEHPAVLERIRSEINESISQDEEITVDKLKQLNYLTCVQNQISRLVGPVGGAFARTAIKDTLIGDVPIKKGTMVNFEMKPIFFDPKYFPDPHSFKPERWQSDNMKIEQNFLSYAFSGGPRTCIGKHLALLQSKIIIVKFIQRYQSLEELHKRTINFGIAVTTEDSEVRVTKRVVS